MPPTLQDPHAGPAGAPAYLKYWGQQLYLEWCQDQHVEPVSYDDFCALTLQRGRDWWCAAKSSPPAGSGTRTCD